MKKTPELMKRKKNVSKAPHEGPLMGIWSVIDRFNCSYIHI